MKDVLHKSLNVLISLSIFFATPVSFANTASTPEKTPTDKEMSNQALVTYFGQLDQQNPLLTEFALGEPITDKPLYKVEGNNPLLDANPFFMRSQKWNAAPKEACNKSVCFGKTADGGVTLQLGAEARALTVAEKFTPVLETDDYIVMTADDAQIFQIKNPGEAEPGEGMFFIAKRDLNKAYAYQFSVPVYFFPLPGAGWTGPNDNAFELGTTDQIVVYNHEGFGLPIDRSDVALLEKVERNNLNLAQSWTILENPNAKGLPLPRANTTLAFGTFLSGQVPAAAQDVGALNTKKIFSDVANLILPQASAHEAEADPTLHQKLANEITAQVETMNEVAPPVTVPESEKRNWWQRWRLPIIEYGATAGLAVAAAPHIDWTQLITSEMVQNVTTVSEMLGGVLAASVVLKYSLHKAIFDKKYPKTADETMLERINKEHKGILDELVHGLWFSMAFLPQGIRHILDFMKDRFFPNNSMIHKAWEATMGYAMKQSSRLAMNWKTFYLGSIVFGMSDAMMVGVHLLIFTPWLMQHFGWHAAVGGATAAFASAEVLRNFLAYLQGGAHSYSADVKMIHLKSAQEEAKRLVQAKGLDPEAAKNEGIVNKLTEQQMEKRFKMVGLPGKDEFLYDPITVLEDSVQRAGFSVQDQANMSEEDKKQLNSADFVLSRRRWGLIKPALKKALETAREAQAKSPSATGAQTVKLLEWAMNNRSLATAVAERTWDVSASSWAQDGMGQSMAAEVEAARVKNGGSINWMKSMWASTKGAIKYLAQDSTKEVRDIRQTLFLMSTSGSPFDVMKFLPKTWTDKAGSEEAAILGAELFNRAFSAYLATDENLIKPDAAMEAAYGPRVLAVMERISRRDPNMFADPFARQVRYWELMGRLKARDEDRGKVLNYKPAAQSAMEQRQWRIAREAAAARMAVLPVEDEVASEWLGVAKMFETKSGEEVIASEWAQSYKYRLIVAQELTKQVGLEVNDLEKSDFVPKVVLAASLETEEKLKQTKEQIYAKSLSPDDRKFYEAQVFTRSFVDKYIDLSVRSDENLKAATSTEYPGRFQGLRKKLVGLPGGTSITKVLRGVEALFRNEETSYAPGIWASLDRNLPVLPDLWHNFTRNLRIMPYILTMSYLTSYYVWHIHTPYPLWALSVGMGFVATSLVEFNNRVMRNYDIKPMDDVPSKLTYAFLHSNLTNPEVMLVQAIAQPVTEGFDKYVTKPIGGAIEACEDLLLHRAH